MKYFNPLRTLRFLTAMSAVSAPVSMPYGVTASAGIAATIACSALNAVAQSPTNPALPPLLPPAQSSATGPQNGPTTAADANANARSLLVKARAALSEGKNEAAAQAFAQATLVAQKSPELASELQQTRQQFVERGLSQQTLDQAMRVAQTGPGLTSRAANALRNNSTANQSANANTQATNGTLPPPGLLASNPSGNANANTLPPAMPAMPSTMPQVAKQPVGPVNPLRDQAVGLAAQAKMALDRGDTTNARQLIQKANELRVPDSEFAQGQLRPWDVALQVDRAERLRGGAASGVTTASAALPVGNVQNATAQSSPLSANSVQPGIYQPSNDETRVAPASGVLSQYDADSTGEELYQSGITALSAGKKEAALRYFKAAWQKQADLDPGLRAQLKDKLTQLQISGAPESIEALSPEGRENQVKRQKWFAEVSGEIADAEKMAAANKPMEALEKLKVLRQRVSQAEIDGAQRKNLLAMVDRVTRHMEEWAEQNKSMIELDQRNKQILDRIQSDSTNLTKADAQVQTLVDQYNDLIQTGRYAEAEEVAKKVREIKPNSEIAALLYNKAKIQRRVEEQVAIRELKEEKFIDHFNSIEAASTPYDGENSLTMPNARDWLELTRRRTAVKDDIRMLPAERKIREHLGQPFSASFDKRPLADAMNTISEMTGIPIVIDDRSIAEEGITIDQPVTLDLKGNSIQLKSALNLMLSKLNLTYTVKDEVLTIESSRFSKRETYQFIYNVKDLVIPIPNFVSDYNTGMAGALQSAYQAQTHMASATVSDPNVAGVAANRIASVDPSSSILTQMNSMGGFGGMSPGTLAGSTPGGFPYTSPGLGGASMANYAELIGLIESTISPDQWQTAGGNSSMREFRQNLSLVVTAPQETHEAIANLLKSLRALQNLQVTIEVRFIQLSDTFFERIGLDFDFNIRDKLGRVAPPSRQNGSPKVAVGLSSGVGPLGPAFTSDLDFQIRNNFGVTPAFGSPDAGDAGTQVGLAILSDLELFFFLQAVQGNSRTNVLNAPKVTMFDGQTATINDTASRPFVTSFDPVVGDFAVAQRPIIVVLSEGTQMNVQSVVSQDKRFVRMTLAPQFTRIESADRQFTFQGRRSTQTGTSILNPNGTPSGTRNNEADIVEGTTVQQPTLGTTSVSTTVSVPDGGTILLGGIKRLREGRTERGTPILSKIPYLNRLFKNNAIGRETNTLMMTVTPRIIIPEEEEEAIGVLPRP